jgi:hypothetical protein
MLCTFFTKNKESCCLLDNEVVSDVKHDMSRIIAAVAASPMMVTRTFRGENYKEHTLVGSV